MNFSWTGKTERATVHTEAGQTSFYNLKNKAEGARRYGYVGKIVKFTNPGEAAVFRTEYQTTLNGSHYQSPKFGSFIETEAQAKAMLAKTIAGAMKRYAKLATQAGSKIEQKIA